MTEFCRFCCCLLFCAAAVLCAGLLSDGLKALGAGLAVKDDRTGAEIAEGLKALGAGIAVSAERSTNAYFDRQERLMGETLQQLRRPGVESEDG